MKNFVLITVGTFTAASIGLAATNPDYIPLAKVIAPTGITALVKIQNSSDSNSKSKQPRR